MQPNLDQPDETYSTSDQPINNDQLIHRPPSLSSPPQTFATIVNPAGRINFRSRKNFSTDTDHPFFFPCICFKCKCWKLIVQSSPSPHTLKFLGRALGICSSKRGRESLSLSPCPIGDNSFCSKDPGKLSPSITSLATNMSRGTNSSPSPRSTLSLSLAKENILRIPDKG